MSALPLGDMGHFNDWVFGVSVHKKSGIFSFGKLDDDTITILFRMVILSNLDHDQIPGLLIGILAYFRNTIEGDRVQYCQTIFSIRLKNYS